MSSIISTFHIDWKIIMAQAVNFVIVIAVLYFFALKPLNKLMAERSEKISKGVSDAKTNAELLHATKAEYDAALAKARAEATNMLNETRRKADQKRTEMVEEAKTDVAALITNGKKTLEAEKIKMVEEAKKEIVALAVEATRKMLKKESDESLDNKSVKELGKMDS